MKIRTRILLCILVLSVISPLIVSCARENGGTDTVTTAPDTTAAAQTEAETTGELWTIEEINYNEKEVTMLVWEEHSMQEFDSEGINGELINDTIFNRNKEVEERLNVKLKFVYTPGDNDTSAQYLAKVAANTEGEYMIYAAYSQVPSSLAMNGQIIDLNSTEYLDFSQPWWPENLIKQASINGKLYFCTGDISTSMLWMMIATFYNKALVKTNNLEDPYELVKSNQWTLDKLMEMCTNIYSDVDSSLNKNTADSYGYIIYQPNIDALFTASGLKALEKDGADNIIVSPDYYSEKIETLRSKLSSFFSNTQGAYNVNSTSIRDIFFDKRAVFTSDRVFIVSGKDNEESSKIEFEYGIVPNPKYNAEQTDYYTNLGFTHTLYCIASVLSDEDADMCSAVLECLAVYNNRNVIPAVFETAMKVKYASDPKATEMYDIIRGSICFELGRLFSVPFNKLTSARFRQAVAGNTAWPTMYASISKQIESNLKTVITTLS